MLRPINVGESSKDYIKVWNRRREDFHLANVDLELECSANLQSLLDELGDKIMTLHHQGFENNSDRANIEIHNYSSEQGWIYNNYNDKEDLIGGVDTLVSAFCNLIKNLSPSSRMIWDKCHRKEFDIGFSSGNTPKTFRTQIRAETVERCAKIGASILITVYPYLNYSLRKETPKEKI